MPKFYVTEMYHYELEADSADEVPELFERLMQDDPASELVFVDNEIQVHDASHWGQA